MINIFLIYLGRFLESCSKCFRDMAPLLFSVKCGEAMSYHCVRLLNDTVSLRRLHFKMNHLGLKHSCEKDARVESVSKHCGLF